MNYIITKEEKETIEDALNFAAAYILYIKNQEHDLHVEANGTLKASETIEKAREIFR